MQNLKNISIETYFSGFLGLILFFGTQASALNNPLDIKLGDSVNIEGEDTSYDNLTGIAKAVGNVRINCGDTNIYAGKAEYHNTSGDIFLEDQVSIYQGELVHKSNAAIYNIKSGEITANELKSGLSPIFYSSGKLQTETEEIDKISMQSSVITTHDSVNPNYKIKAKEVRIEGINGPEEKRRIIFNNMTIYAGKIPVLWLPYLSQPLDAEQSFRFLPGYKNNWGAFLMNQYGMMINDEALATYHLDFRSSRGIAGGLDIDFNRNDKNSTKTGGAFRSYYVNDQDTTLTHNNRKRDEDLSPDRYRLNLQHRFSLLEKKYDELFLSVDINKLSDQYFYEDFFPEEYRLDPKPDNIIGIQKTFPNAVASIWTRFQANDFYRTDTRLPEIAFESSTVPIGKTGMYYTGSTTAGLYENNLTKSEKEQLSKLRHHASPTNQDIEKIDPDILIGQGNILDRIKNAGDLESNFTRIDTYHELKMPKQLFGWLNITPRAGFKGTSYSDINGSNNNDTRKAIHAGIDSSFKMSRDFNNFSMPHIGLPDLRHVAEPFVRYSYVSVDELNSDIGKIDRLVSTTKLRPLHLSEFTATDEINDWSIIRSGISNQFITSRDGEAHEWLRLNSYLEHYIDDPEYDRDFSNIYNEISLTPVPWFSLSHEISVPLLADDPMDYTESNTWFTFMPTDNLEFNVAHRYLKDHPILEESDLLDFRTYYRVTDRLGISARQRYEFDDGTLEFQQYSIHYDLNSWTAGLGALMADHRSDKDEFGLVFTLTLKDFPSLSLPVGITPSQ